MGDLRLVLQLFVRHIKLIMQHRGDSRFQYGKGKMAQVISRNQVVLVPCPSGDRDALSNSCVG